MESQCVGLLQNRYFYHQHLTRSRHGKDEISLTWC
jgi:hypothetical protein